MQRLRSSWVFGAAGFLFGVIAAVLAVSAGVQVYHAGRDLTLAAALVVEAGLALAGFALGRSFEAQAAERRRLEIAQHSFEELASLQARLADAHRMATVGRLAATVAHEVRNPLAIIRSMVQNLSDTVPATAGNASRSAYHAVIEEIDRLSRVISTLVGLSRSPVPRLASVDPQVLLMRAEWLARRLLNDRSVLLAVRLVGPQTPLLGDLDLLCQVLLELVANAAQATPAGGTIRLESRRDDGVVVLSVTDDGPGIPPAVRGRVFDPFFTTKAGGSGIGLAVARDIVVSQGGTIEAGEGEGGGACVIVRMPVTAGT